MLENVDEVVQYNMLSVTPVVVNFLPRMPYKSKKQAGFGNPI